jgi:hypothetical protein
LFRGADIADRHRHGLQLYRVVLGYGDQMKRDLLTARTPEHEKQLDMARNIAMLKTKQSKRQQAHMLCASLVNMIKGGMIEKQRKTHR